MRSTIVLLLLLFTITTAKAEEGIYDDIKLVSGAHLPYVPSAIGQTTIGSLFTIAGLITLYHIYFTGSKRETWALVLPIGLVLSGLGFWLRLALRLHQTVQLLYNISSMLVVLSPCTFLAFNYILFGRLLAALHGYEMASQLQVKSPYSFISASKIKTLFLTSDIITFIIQSEGSSLLLDPDIGLVHAGSHVFIIGTCLQSASYFVFVIFILFTHHRLARQAKSVSAAFDPKNPSIKLIYLLYISSIGILVRSLYRIVETAIGFSGYLTLHEKYFFCVDAAPLLLATLVWVMFWPGLVLTQIQNRAAIVDLNSNSTFEVMQAKDEEP